jgi:hypothetical protein
MFTSAAGNTPSTPPAVTPKPADPGVARAAQGAARPVSVRNSPGRMSALDTFRARRAAAPQVLEDKGPASLAALRDNPVYMAELRLRHVWRSDSAGQPLETGTHMCIWMRSMEEALAVDVAATKAWDTGAALGPKISSTPERRKGKKYLQALKTLTLPKFEEILALVQHSGYIQCGPEAVLAQPLADALCYELFFFVRRKVPDKVGALQLPLFEAQYADSLRRGKEVLDLAFTGALPQTASH